MKLQWITSFISFIIEGKEIFDHISILIISKYTLLYSTLK